MRKLRIPIRIFSSDVSELNDGILHAVTFCTTREYIGLTGMDFKSTDLIPM